MRVRLTVGRWDQRVDGEYVRHYRGDVVDVDADTGAWLVRAKAGVDVDAEPEPKQAKPTPKAKAEAEAEVKADADEPVDTEAEPAPERPRQTANKAEWVAYAVALGMDPSAAEDLTRAQLIAATAQA